MKVKYTIEPNWTIHSYSDEVEIPDEELEGMTEDERERHIETVVSDQVNNVVSWGFEIV